MWVIIAIFSAIIFGLASVLMKIGTNRGYLDHYILLGLYLSGSIFFISISWHHFANFNWTVLFIALLIAVGSFFGNWSIIKALECGPASLTAPMLNINIFFIILMSVVFFNEPLNIMKVIIIVLLIISVILVKFDPSKNFSVKNKMWFIWVLVGSILLFLREGMLKVSYEIGLNNSIVLLTSYLLCVIFSIFFIILYKRKLSIIEFILNKEAISFGFMAGICSAGGLYLYSLSLILGPASIVASIFSSRSIVIVLLSSILLKERLSFMQKNSVLILCAGVFCASMLRI